MLEPISNVFTLGPVVGLIVGIVILLAGRSLFWLTVGVVGFIFALGIALDYLEGQPIWLLLILALFAGIIGAVLALLLQKVAIIAAGFLMSGYLALWLLNVFFNLGLGSWEWPVFILGGIIGVFVALVLFEYALIIISSLVGAMLILQITNFAPWLTIVLLVILFLVGLSVQSRSLRT